jgi:hypothetical protein
MALTSALAEPQPVINAAAHITASLFHYAKNGPLNAPPLPAALDRWSDATTALVVLFLTLKINAEPKNETAYNRDFKGVHGRHRKLFLRLRPKLLWREGEEDWGKSRRCPPAASRRLGLSRTWARPSSVPGVIIAPNTPILRQWSNHEVV